jgi:thiosulfate reductase/polysulfide reductase chain A
MTEIRKSICWGCWMQCGAEAHVDQGRVVGLKGDPDFYTKGFFCDRGTRFTEHLYHPDRVNYPLKRMGERGEGRWKQISWDQALDEIAEKLKEIKEKYGAEALATTGGTARGHQETFKERFLHLFGSPNKASAGQFCRIQTREIAYAIYGADIAAMKPRSGEGEGCIVIWGHNPKESVPVEYHEYRNIKKTGKIKFIVIDPKQTEVVDEFADIWLPIRPGTDAALALGWLNVIINEELYDKEFVEKWCYGFDKLKKRVQEYPPERVAEITWVPKEKIIESARMFAKSKPYTSIPWGVKTDMQGRNVTSIIHAIAILRAMTGSLNVGGGSPLVGPCQKANGGPDFNYIDMLSSEQRAKQLGAEKHKFWTFPGYELISKAMRPYWNGKICSSYMPACHEPDVWQAILTGNPYPIKALIAGGNNPLIAYANAKQIYRALKSPHLELFAVVEQWLTPSAMLADYVLPATNWLEMPLLHLGTYTGFQDFVAASEQVIPALYERRPDYYFWQGLGKRLEQEKYWRRTLEEEWEWCIKPLLDELNMESFEEFVREKRFWFPPFEERYHEKIDPKTGRPKGFGTPTGKIEFCSTILEKLGYDPLPHFEEPAETLLSQPGLSKEYPLILITGSRFRPFHHSEHRQLPSARKLYPDPTIEIHPDTAKRFGIEEGEWTIVETTWGKIKQRARFSTRIDPRMVDIQHGWWFPEEIPDDPILYRAFESNANVLTTDKDEYCDPPTGALNLSPYLCKVYPAKKYY